MMLSLRRRWFYRDFTGGNLLIDGAFFCRTIEDAVRTDGVKVAGETAIPAGIYRVELTMSPKFKKVLPELVGVPNFSGVRIHSGTTAADSRGCVLVGEATDAEMSKGTIRNSRITLSRLMAVLLAEQKNGHEIYIEIA